MIQHSPGRHEEGQSNIVTGVTAGAQTVNLRQFTRHTSLSMYYMPYGDSLRLLLLPYNNVVLRNYKSPSLTFASIIFIPSRDLEANAMSFKGKQTASESPEHLHDLQPAPLFSPRPSTKLPSLGLPHLVDLDVEEPSVVRHKDDHLFWNSVLEEAGDEPVPERDALGLVGEPGRSYWVKGVLQHTSTARDNGFHEIASQGGPVAQDFALEDERSRNSSPTSEYSNADLYAPPTPPWPKRSHSLKLTRFEPAHESPDLFIGQDERSQQSFVMRGGGKSVEPIPFKINLPANILGGIMAIAQTDPLRQNSRSVNYKARPSVVHKMDNDGEEIVTNGAKVPGDTLNYPHPLEPEAPRPSTPDLENAYGTFPPESENPGPPYEVSGSVSAQAWNPTLTPTTNSPHTSVHTPPMFAPPLVPVTNSGIEEHPALRNSSEVEHGFFDSFGEQPPVHIHQPTPLSPNDRKTPPPPLRGIPIDISEKWPPTHASPSPLKARGRSHSYPFANQFYDSPSMSSLGSALHSYPSDFPTYDEGEEITKLNAQDINPYSTLNMYERTLASQTKSIRKLHRVIDELTERRDYYEQKLLPETLTHWSDTNKENHALGVAVRKKQDENALLWNLLEFSRKVLNLCYQRDEAVLHTAKMMRGRKIHRANRSLLKRVLGNFGPGRGGKGQEEENDIGSKRVESQSQRQLESPFRKDLEQLVFVCEQNMRLLGEDLQDWSGNLSSVQAMKDAQLGEHEERMNAQTSFRDV